MNRDDLPVVSDSTAMSLIPRTAVIMFWLRRHPLVDILCPNVSENTRRG